MPPPMRNPMTDGIDKPKRLKDVPKYVLEKIKGFFSRLFYIFALVWQSAPFIFVAMVLLCLLDGVLPVVGAYITAELLNEISALIVERSFVGISSDAWVVMQPLAILFIINLIYLFVKRIIAKISNMITAVAGELVVNHIKLKLIKTQIETELRAAELLEIEEQAPSFSLVMEKAEFVEAAEVVKAAEIIEEAPIIEVEGAELLDMSDVTLEVKDIEQAIAAPDVILEEIDFVEESDPYDEELEEEEGVEVIGVVWPERAKKNKIYRYDPNGEKLNEGDIVLAPSRDAAKNKDIVRKVAVAHANHRVAPESLAHPLKKIIGIVKRRAEALLTPSDEKIEKLLDEEKKNKK